MHTVHSSHVSTADRTLRGPEGAGADAEGSGAPLPARVDTLGPRHGPGVAPGRGAHGRPTHGQRPWIERVGQGLANANKELWLILSMLLIALALNHAVASQRIVLGFYTLPTLFSAYFFGRRHAVLTAFASVCLVVLLACTNPGVLSLPAGLTWQSPWLSDVVAWAGMLVVTAYAMGTLYERSAERLSELRSTYQGLLLILRQFISNDKYTENHSYRVSVYAATIAVHMGLPPARVEDVRAGALLHDIGKLDVSRDLLYKAASLSAEERERMGRHTEFGAMLLSPVNDTLDRVLPIILLHHARYDHPEEREGAAVDVPVEARVVAVADVYDALTSDRPYRAAMTPFDARDAIVKDAGRQFDPDVVRAFLMAFERGKLEVPRIVV